MSFPEGIEKAPATLVRFAGLRDSRRRDDIYRSAEWQTCMLDILLAVVSGEEFGDACKREDVSQSTVLRWFLMRPTWVLPLSEAIASRRRP
jgi:hypothetical protein